MVCVMKWLKGVVVNKKDGLIQIELETGRRIWTTPSFSVEIREQILISWDYTHDRVKRITTPKKLTHEETDEDIAEAEAGNLIIDNNNKGDNTEIEEHEEEIINEGFSLPLVEEDEDEAEVEGEVFSTSKDEESEGEADAVSVHRHNINSLLL